MPRFFPSVVLRYGICVLTSVLAALLHIVLAPVTGSEPLFTLYYAVVMFCGWYWGLGPGLFATILCAAFSFYLSEYYLTSDHQLTDADILRFTLFILGSVMISILNHIWHNTRHRAMEAAQEAQRHADSVRRSEERFRLAVEAVNGIIYEWDIGAGTVMRSSKLSDILGYDSAEIPATQEWWIDQIHPDDVGPMTEIFEKVVAGRTLRAEVEYRVKGAEGFYHHVLDRMHCSYDIDGNLQRVIGCTIDITERKRAEVEREQLLALEQEATASAEAARRQSAFLAEASVILTSSLDHRQTLERLARIIVETLSDSCLIYLDGGEGEVVMTHYDTSKDDLIRKMAEIWRPDPNNDASLITKAMRSGSSQLVPDFTDADVAKIIHDPEFLPSIRLLDPRSIIVVPLIARERLLGAMLLMITDSGRRYGEADLVIAEDLARRAALAIDNARLFEAERESRRLAEEAAERTVRIQEVTAALSQAITTPDISLVIIDRVVAAMGARSGSLALLSNDGSSLELIRSTGYADATLQAWRHIPLSLSLPHTDAVKSGEPVWIESYEDLIEIYPHLADGVGVRDSEARVSMPLIASGRVVGAIGLSFTERKTFTLSDRDYLLIFARQCSQALERAWLYEGEHHARAEAERAERRLAFLSEASTRLAGSLDYDETIRMIAHLAVPRIAGCCMIDIVDAAGRIDRVAALHRDPAKQPLLDAIGTGLPFDATALHGSAAVIRDGRGELFAAPSEEMLAAVSSPKNRAEVKRLDLTSMLSVPLAAHGRTFGAITLATSGASDCLNESDLELASEFALRAAVALENARLYSDAQEEIAKRERMQIALRDNEARLRRLTESNIIGVFTATFDGNIIESNEAFLSMIGYTREELLRGEVHWERMTPPEYREKDRLVLQELRATGVSQPWEKEYIRKDGSRVFVLLGVVLLENMVDSTICFAVDITEQKRVERELEQAKESAEAASRAKDHFLAVLSHELRTPLTPVLAAIHALGEMSRPDTEERVLADIIRRNVELEARLIDDLLDLTRIERGKVQLNLEAADAHLLLQSAIEICRDDIAGKHLELTVDLDATRHHVYADPARLQQVFWNLIKNAVKFTPEGGTVGVRTRVGNNGNLQVEVSDTGIGIEAELLPKIFDAFEQGGQGITRQFGGLGLGLAISRTVMQLHGGRLSAVSGGRSRGATFIAEIGLIDPGSMNSSRINDVRDRKSDRKDVRILLVDDHKDTNRVIQLFLNRQGYQVYAAHTMSSALALAAGEDFDLVISDIGLPDGSGLELMRRLRAEGPMKGIALSGYGMEEDIRRSIEVGFAEHLTKPVSAQKLQEVIQRLVAETMR